MRRLVMGLVLALIPFVFLEVGLRVAGIGGSIIYDEDPDCAYRPRPNQRFSTMGFPVTILENGFRGPAARSGVLFVGDSVTYGTAYVRDEETFPALLGGANAGVNGWGLQNMERFLRAADLSGYTQVVWTVPSCDALRSYTTLRKGLISTNRRMWLRLEYMFRFFWYGMIVKQPETRDPAFFEENLESLCRAAEDLKRRGIPLLVVLLPYEKELRGDTVLETPYMAELKTRLMEMDIPHTVAVPQGEPKDLYRDGTHLTPAGNRWLAAWIAAELNRLQVPHSSQPGPEQAPAGPVSGPPAKEPAQATTADP